MPLRPLGTAWEALGRLLELPSELLGRSGEPSGVFLRPLGGVLGLLRAVLGPLETVSLGYVARMQFQKKMGFDLGPILRPKRLRKRVQSGVRNVQKSRTNFNMKQEGFEDPLGSVLGLSWVVLGPILGSNIMKFQGEITRFREQTLI